SLLGDLIKGIRKITDTRIALITNSSLLTEKNTRQEALLVDLIVPSLDAVTQKEFEKIDRPVKGVKIKKIIESLINFGKIFKGEMWLEVMLVNGINDSPSYLKKIKKVSDSIRPDRVQLNIPVRLPAEDWVKPPSKKTLGTARKIFGPGCDIVC
ncbi:MAG TPA: radical SAM protein, partial [Candidatus Omnitrophota bacterium]|nr:radical SAM protein [Candidatus Omnitrophota bacterium]